MLLSFYFVFRGLIFKATPRCHRHSHKPVKPRVKKIPLRPLCVFKQELIGIDHQEEKLKVLTYQTTRDCLLGSLLNSVHIERTKIKECPSVQRERVAEEVSSVYNPVTSLQSLHILHTSYKSCSQYVSEELDKRGAGRSVLYVLYGHISVKLTLFKNVASFCTFQNKSSIIIKLKLLFTYSYSAFSDFCKSDKRFKFCCFYLLHTCPFYSIIAHARPLI